MAQEHPNIIKLDISDLYEYDIDSSIIAKTIFKKLKEKKDVIVWYTIADFLDLRYPRVAATIPDASKAETLAENVLIETLRKYNISINTDSESDLTSQLEEIVSERNNLIMLEIFDGYGYDVILFKK